ncbi:hypothetical protein ACWJKU_18230 [Methylocaldum sp. MU1018]
MKNKLLPFAFAAVAVSLPMMSDVVLGEETAAAAENVEQDNLDLDPLRASIRMERRDFIKQSMNLSEEQGKKFWSLYHQYEADLMKLNNKRLAVIEDYADSLDDMSESKIDGLVKRSLDYRKARTALLEKYYGKIAKATSKTIAARFLQVEGVLQGAGDAEIGSSLPLVPTDR